MNKLKVDFIAELLSNKRISVSDKERLFALSLNELKKIGDADDYVRGEIEKIKNIIGISHEVRYTQDKSDESLDEIEINTVIKDSNTKKSHRPIETKNLLVLFQNSLGLKYLTHRFRDKNPSYESFIELCKEEFIKAKTQFRNVPDILLARIDNFAFSDMPNWFIRRGNEKVYIQLGWSSHDFEIWYKNSSIHPSDHSRLNKEMIEPFKNSIEVRAGKLPEIINNAITLVDSEGILDIQLVGLEEAEFYTDVDSLGLAIFRIIGMIKEWANKNFNFSVKIEYFNHTILSGKYKEIRITHINSKSNKRADDPTFEKGDMIDLRNALWGLCNFEISAEFVEGYKKKVILTDEVKSIGKTYSIQPGEIAGFTYSLNFY